MYLQQSYTGRYMKIMHFDKLFLVMRIWENNITPFIVWYKSGLFLSNVSELVRIDSYPSTHLAY